MFVNLRASGGPQLCLMSKNDHLEASRKVWAEAIRSWLSPSIDLASLGIIWEVKEQHWCVVDDLYLRMLGQLCAWAESTWPEVGRVDRRDQQNTLFVTLVGLAKGIEAYWSQFFADFDRFIMLTCRSDAYILRSGDFRADNNSRTNQLLYPLRMRTG